MTTSLPCKYIVAQIGVSVFDIKCLWFHDEVAQQNSHPSPSRPVQIPGTCICINIGQWVKFAELFVRGWDTNCSRLPSVDYLQIQYIEHSECVCECASVWCASGGISYLLLHCSADLCNVQIALYIAIIYR